MSATPATAPRVRTSVRMISAVTDVVFVSVDVLTLVSVMANLLISVSVTVKVTVGVLVLGSAPGSRYRSSES